MDGRGDTANAAAHTLLSDCPRQLAIFECEDAKKWEGFTESLWKEALHESRDIWTVYQAFEGELPTPAEASTYDAIVISGSHYSAYEEHEWIRKLLQLLPQYVAQGTRMYGCCFGGQILARALGGSVGQSPGGNFVLTIEQIQPTAELQQLTELHAVVQEALQDGCKVADSSYSSNNTASPAEAAAGAGNGNGQGSAAHAAAVDGSAASVAAENGSAEPTAAVNRAAAAHADAVVDGLQELDLSCSSGCFRLIESHGDQVLTLPPGAIRLATSPTATNELWCYGPNVLATQFHVEFDEPLVLEKIWQSLKENGRLDARQAEESRRILEAGGQQNANMLQVIKFFLKHGIPGVTPVIADPDSGTKHSSSSSSKAGAGEASSSSSDHGGDPGSSSSSRGSGNPRGPASGCCEDHGDAGTSSNSKIDINTSGSDADTNRHRKRQQQQQQHGGSAELVSSNAAAAAGKTAQGPSQAAALAPTAAPQVPSQETIGAAEFTPKSDSNTSSSHTAASTGLGISGDATPAAAAQAAAKDTSSNSDHSSSAGPAATSALPGTSCDPAEQQQQQTTITSSSSTGLGLPPIAVQLGPTASHLSAVAGAASGNTSANPSANPSGANSPTAMSDHSNATATSASSAVPFAHIAYHRRQQQREEGLTESSQRLIEDSSAAFDLRMQCYTSELETLQQLNDVAADQYSSTAEIATALCQFVTDLDTRQAAVREALAALPQLDRQLKFLEAAVGQLDKRSKDLEAKLGLGRSSAYDYLASTFSRAGSGVGAAAAAAGCLGGPTAVKQ